MKVYLVILLMCFLTFVRAQEINTANDRDDPEYLRLRDDALTFLENIQRNAASSMSISDNVVPYCRGKFAVLAIVLGDSTTKGIDSAVRSFLHRNKIPLTVFLSGEWLNSNGSFAELLLADTTCEIENGGLKRAGSLSLSATSSHSTKNLTPADYVDDIELNARRLYALSHKKPMFYLPSQKASRNEVAAIACYLNEYIFMPDMIVPDDCSLNDLGKKADRFQGRCLAIVIHPTAENQNTVISVVETLKAAGFSFVKLARLVN